MIRIFLLGVILQVAKSLTCTDPLKPYLTSSSLKCVAKCSDEGEFATEKVPNTCIKKDSCDGYFLDSNGICLINNCELQATLQKPAVYMKPQISGKTYRECITCSTTYRFGRYSFKSDIPSSCFSCTMNSLVEDYFTGKCSRMEDLTIENGFLDKDNRYLPFTEKCPSGQYLINIKNPESKSTIKKCSNCPPSLPLSSDDRLSCHRTCPDGKIADETSRSCVDAVGFTCKGQLSSDKKMCSSGCPAGEIKDAFNIGNCIQCPAAMPFRNNSETKCLIKCGDRQPYHKQLSRCLDYATDCGFGFITSSDGKTCGELCKQNEEFGLYSCLDCTNKYKYNLHIKQQTYCSDSCPSGQFGDPTTMTCQPYSQCSKFITGTVPICSNTCQRGEFMHEKDPSQSYIQCSQCDNYQYRYTDPSSGLRYCKTQSCSLTSEYTCVNECQNNELLIESNTRSYCALTCSQSSDFKSYEDVQPKCTATCDLGIKSYVGTQKICTQSCQQGEIAFDKSLTQQSEQNFICTTDSCPQNFKLYTFKKQQYCAKKCYILSINKKDCVEKCEDGQFAVEDQDTNYKYRARYQCQKGCAKIYQYKMQDMMVCSDQCRSHLSADGKTCGTSCKAGEFASQRQYYELYTNCSTNSCYKFVFVDEKGNNQCISQCKRYLLPDKKTCLNSCPTNFFALDKKFDQAYQLCSETCETFGYTDDQGVKRCSTYCPYILSTDQKACSKQCLSGEYVNDKSHTTPYNTCSPACENFEYYLEDQIKRCTEICPDNYVESFSKQKKICIKRSNCNGVISSDNQKCIEKCDENKREYPSVLLNVKQCKICSKYFIVQSGVGNCLDECPNNLIGVPSKNKCVSLEESKKECEGMKLSVDKKKCTDACEYPDIIDSKGQCKKPCSPSDQLCQQCDENELIQVIQIQEICIPKDACRDYISFDGKRCTSDCSFSFEIKQDKSKICAKCKDDEVPVKTPNSINLLCVKKDDPSLIFFQVQQASFLGSSFYDSKYKIETIKKWQEELTIKVFEQLKQEYAPVQEFVEKYVKGLYQMSKQIILPDLDTAKQIIGSKNNIITLTQKQKNGFKFKNQFNLESIQNGAYDMLEEIQDQSTEEYPILQTTVFAQNPCCKSENCKYPLFYLYKETKVRILQYQRQPSRQFTVTFNIDKPDQIKRYACVSYDLYDIFKKPTQMQATISNDNKSISCAIETNVSLLFDTQCDFIDKSNCYIAVIENPKDKNGEGDVEGDSDDGLSSGAIAGIAIGVSALAILLVLVGVHIYKKRNQVSSKDQFYKTTNQENSPGGSPKYDTKQQTEDQLKL